VSVDTRLVGAVFLAALAVACTREASSHDEASADEERTCQAGFTTPEGFQQTESLRDPYPDHVGIRLGFVSDDGRELHYFAGIPGEFGEGLPSAGDVMVAQGLEGPLQGGRRTWVLSWHAPGPCGARAVLGTGFTRAAFLQTLERAAIIPAQ
jgi:hypothetical protein